MEDHKKTDVIKNMRTVLPPINLKKTEPAEAPAAATSATAEQEMTGGAGQQKTQDNQGRVLLPSALGEQASMGIPPPGHLPKPPYGYRPPERMGQAERPTQMHIPPNRYRMHAGGGYAPYTPYGGATPGYPPGRHPPYIQTRYYPPPARQYAYVPEMPPHVRGQMEHGRMGEKKGPMHPHSHPPHQHHGPPHHPPYHAPMHPQVHPQPHMQHQPPQGYPHMQHQQMHPPQMHSPGQHPSAVLMPDIGNNAKVQIKDAMRYLDVVKEEYKDNKEVYNRFLRTMRDYKERQIDAKRVIEIILMLFSGNPKLIQGFNQFLPKKYEILPSGEIKVHDVEKGERDHKRRGDEHGPSGGLYGSFPPQHPPYPPMHVVKSEYDGGRPHPDSRPEFEVFPPGARQHVGKYEIDNTARVVAYLNKVRRRLEHSPAAWFDFLKIVQSYRNNRDHRPIPEILARVKAILKDEPGLIEEFILFLPGNAELHHMRPGSRQHQPDTLGMLLEIKHVLVRKGVHKEFVKALNMFNQGLLNSSSLILLIEPFLSHSPTLLSLFRYYIGHREPDTPPHIQASLETYKKLGSYRVLPERYRKSMHTGQTPEDASVLNTSLISCPTFSSESSTFIFAKKNVHEDTLFRVEDERYEADLLLARVSSLLLKLTEHEALIVEEETSVREPESPREQTVRDAALKDPAEKEAEEKDLPKEPLVAPAKEQAPPESALSFSLSDIDKEILGVVYGASADDIILGLIAHPLRAIPVVIRQLRSIEAQWFRTRATSSEIWKNTIDKNYIKALDVKGYKVRNGERKTTMLKQFMKDIDTATAVEFKLLSRKITNGVVDVLIASMDLEEGDEAYGNIRMLQKIIQTNRVFFLTPEIYCALRGIACAAHKIYESLHGRRVKPKVSGIARNLGLQEETQPLSLDALLDLVKDYVLGNIETTKFEEKIIGCFGVSGASLIGISGVCLGVEAMIDTMGDHKASMEMLRRIGGSNKEAPSALSEVLLRTPNLLKVVVKRRKDASYIMAKKVAPQKYSSPKWAGYVKSYSTKEGGRGPFLARTFRPTKRKAILDYGMEHEFSEDKYKLKHISGTEDFFLAKRARTEKDEGKKQASLPELRAPTGHQEEDPAIQAPSISESDTATRHPFIS